MKQRIIAARIKEGSLCLRGKYITARYGEDTKTVELAVHNQYISLRGFTLVEIIAGYRDSVLNYQTDKEVATSVGFSYIKESE